MSVINLPTHEQVTQVLKDLGVIDTIVDTIKVNTATANLGETTASATNAPNAVAHAKLNWLLSTLATVNTNTNKSPTIMKWGTNTNAIIKNAEISATANNNNRANVALDVVGSGRVRAVVPGGDGAAINVDDKWFFITSNTAGGFVDIPFRTKFKVQYANNTPTLIWYELN